MGKRTYLLLLFIPLIGILFGVFHYHKLTFRGKVCLITLGRTKPEQVKLLKNGIEQFYGFSVEVLPEQPLPQEAYYQPRGRYKADLLLDYLAGIKPDEDDKIIALVQKDISVKTKEHADWGIMGLARLGGVCCVVSTFRLNKDQPIRAKFNERLTKVALHEIGHTLGLDHCTQSVYCMMNDANGSIKTIDKERIELCERCQEKISYTKKS